MAPVAASPCPAPVGRARPSSGAMYSRRRHSPGLRCPHGVPTASPPPPPPPMETPEASGAIVPLEVSPELLEPLVTVVAVLGELGAAAGDVPLTGTQASLRGKLVVLVTTIKQAMGHRHGEATRLRHALAAAGTTRAAIGTTVGTTPEPAVPRATTGDAWANVAAVVREWRKAVASARSTWDGVTQDATCLRDACGAVATAGATAGTTAGHLAAAVAREDRARRQLLLFTQELPVATDVATAVSEVAAHGNRVAEACAGLCAATEATERTAVAMVGTAVAAERRRRAAAAGETLERLVAACHGVTRFYCHLQHLLKAIEASVAVTAAGCGGPEGGRGGPQAPGVAREAPGVAREAPGVPEDLMPAVAAAEMLWDASAHLAQGHLLKTLGMARGLLVTSGVPDATAAATVAQNCRDATAALPGLLRRGRR